MSYFQLDRDLLTSSTWALGSPESVKVWIYLLLAANPRTGVVEDADPAIALRCGLSLEATTAALDWLASPDQFSRTRSNAGRRLERLPDGGLRLLNYLKHRDKDHSTPRVRSWRERKKAAKKAARAETVGNTVSPLHGTVGNEGQGQGHGHNERTTAVPMGNEQGRLDRAVKDLASGSSYDAAVGRRR